MWVASFESLFGFYGWIIKTSHTKWQRSSATWKTDGACHWIKLITVPLMLANAIPFLRLKSTINSTHLRIFKYIFTCTALRCIMNGAAGYKWSKFLQHYWKFVSISWNCDSMIDWGETHFKGRNFRELCVFVFVLFFLFFFRGGGGGGWSYAMLYIYLICFNIQCCRGFP